MLCLTVIICLYLEESNPPSGTPQFHYFHQSLEDHAIGSHETDFGGDGTSSQGKAINYYFSSLQARVCSPMPASDLMEKNPTSKKNLNSKRVILGTVRNFGIFFSPPENLKQLDVSMHGTQASAQLGPSDAGDLYQYTLQEDFQLRPNIINIQNREDRKRKNEKRK